MRVYVTENKDEITRSECIHSTPEIHGYPGDIFRVRARVCVGVLSCVMCLQTISLLCMSVQAL